MGLGYVPAGPVRQERQGDDVSRREHRGTRADLGSLGESIAALFLEGRGAEVLERNAGIGRGEIDLVILHEGERAAIEVKAGSDGNDPLFHFDEEKQAQVRHLAGRRGIRRVDYVGVSVSDRGAIVRWLPRVG